MSDAHITAMATTTTGGAPLIYGIEWRYLRRSRVVHAIGYNSLTPAATARCGLSPWDPSDWLGTGTQIEYETADALPPCRRCLSRIPTGGTTKTGAKP
jgi:hypothetical protein